MIINKSGVAIRLIVNKIRIAGRATQGVRLIKLRDDDSIASCAKINRSGTISVSEHLIEDDIIENNDVNDFTTEIEEL